MMNTPSVVLCTLLAAALWTAMPLAHAEDRAVRGAGSLTCASYLQDIEGKQANAVWVQGFVSGLNVAHPTDSISEDKLPTVGTIRRLLDKTCTQQPDNPLSKVAIALFFSLAGSR